MGFTIHISNNCPQVMAALENAKERALKSCGEVAVNYAQDACPVATGNLMQHIDYAMADENTVQIGTNVEYAPYVELGTGPYSTVGGGTGKESWHYQDAFGEWHTGYPQPARPFIKPAVADHADEYNRLIEDSFRNA